MSGETLGCPWVRWAAVQWCLSQTSPCQERSSCVRQACRGTKGRLRQRCALTWTGCEKPPCPQKSTFTSTQTAPTGRSAGGLGPLQPCWREVAAGRRWAAPCGPRLPVAPQGRQLKPPAAPHRLLPGLCPPVPSLGGRGFASVLEGCW